jgi:carboxymethylenebutenolidase
VIEQTTLVDTPDGSTETFTVHPDGGGRFPAVSLYMDAPGIREALREFCRRIAAQGYYAVLPDMYYRLGRLRFDFSQDPAGVRKRMFEAMNSLSNELVMRDTEGLLAFLARQDAVKPGKTGCIGYCMSGQYVVSAAGTFPEQIAAAASLYGVGIVTDEPDSPHLLADRIRGELYLGFAETDEYVPDHVIPDLQAALGEHGVKHRLDVWPDTQHGFCFPERVGMYAEDAAEKVWGLVFDLYDRAL